MKQLIYILILEFLTINSFCNIKQTIVDTIQINRLLRKGFELQSENPESSAYYFLTITETFDSIKSEIDFKNLSSYEKEFLITVIKANNKLGNIYYYDDQYKRAGTYFEQSLWIADKASFFKYEANALYDIGYIRYSSRDYKEAKKLFEKSNKIYSEIQEKKGMLKTLNACGLSNYHMGNYVEADSCFTQALNIADKINDSTLISDIKIHLGILYCEQGNLKSGIKLFEEALDFYENTGNRDAVSDAQLNIGVVMKLTGEYDKALDYILKSTKIEEQAQKKSKLAVRYYNLADLYLQMNNSKKAYDYCQKAFSIAGEIASQPFLSETNFITGKYFMSEKDFQKAIKYFSSALNVAEKNHNQTLVANIYLWYAQAYFGLKQYDNAEKFGRKTYETAKKLNLISLQRDAALLLSDIFDKTKKHKQALFWYKNFRNLSDSIKLFEQKKEIKRIEARYNYDKKERENELLRNKTALQKVKLKNRSVTMAVLTMAILLSIAIIVLLVNRIKYAKVLSRKQQMETLQKLNDLNKELEGKNRELTTKMMFLNQKNKLIDKIINQLQEIQHKPDINLDEVNTLINELRSGATGSNWKEFEMQFVHVHPDFYKRLYEKYPDLTSWEQKIAAFLRMNLNTKEIAAITGRSPKSIEVARSRLRKKLGLSRRENLNGFLASI